MRRSARTDLCGGRTAMIVPTAPATHCGANRLSPLVHNKYLKMRKHREFLRRLFRLCFYRLLFRRES
jgi:hypothetical protein